MEKRRKILFSTGVVLLLVVIAAVFIFGVDKINHWRVAESNKLLLESQNIVDVKKGFFVLQKAALLNPTEKVYLLTGEKAQTAGYAGLAAYYFKKIKSADGYYELGNIYYQNNQYDNAKKSYTKSLAKKVNQKTLIGLGKVYLQKEDTKNAKREFDQANAFVRDNQEVIYHQDLINLISNGKIIIEINNLNPKRAELEKITHSPTLSTRINLLYQYLKSNNYPQLAYFFLKDKGEGKQLDRDGYLLLANEYYSQGNYDKSYQYLLSAKAIDQYYPQTYQHLLEVAGLLNKKDEVNKYSEFLESITW